MKLFHAWGSCSLASLIALEEAGADYELAIMSTRTGDQRRPEYLALNPKGRVPALVTDRGVLTETPAILSWIPETYPEAQLLPVDAWERARAHAFNSYLCSTVHVAHSHKHRGYRWADQASSFADMTRKVPQNEIACHRLIEDELFVGPWVMGEQYTVCDGYLFTLFGWLEADGVDPRQFGRLFEHSQRVGARPAVRKVLAKQAA
ncbi:MAG TPA: glutathione S-transferase N-terminal domain-containing protein [Phenylobacterium sp.]|uniref:glutathione S-transferase family protein n=1 Tax=Phenylobacterium sp. TaxID=1871053 RepID=UPI002C256E13|nr:glutathione S-transferase N-terminal domain-containing protein [Phenylobacterium sp.]HSV02187.1 glutathione S-transferase N-terminal domain-containing protein [Phenylobacterium sp.]